ncbi:salicylate 1-hydroxylase-like protein [Pleomassaria siparia CBS 279.74]|uniref:Salicylate 1-hydroxylase-like protein n=1 Tax=Pleomassaria siparia CBS 279.74 TaxID=1314801 RepID=A0A6G1K344_9PLEO|nr:salicylate 1-hydroxylase-like protein [Pleomassaria siparia CBS 279.74]
MATIPTSSQPFNIAIIGGGIAGLTLATGLLKHDVPFTLYESASKFGEIGAGVGFHANMVRTMDLISPKIREGFLRSANLLNGNPPVWFTVRVGDERKADGNGIVLRRDGKEFQVDEALFDVYARSGPAGGIHRAHFVDELVKLIPSDRTQFRKRLVDITEVEDGSGDACVHFADGTTAQHSAVIGCDGIKSRTRELVLGEGDAKPVFSGKYAYRGLIPMTEAKKIMGEEGAMGKHIYVGYGGHVLTFPIAKGTIVNVVAFNSRENWTDPEWVVQTSRDGMLADYSTWCPTVQSIVSAMQKPDIWALFNHNPAPTYVKTRPRICLLGDAAHASTPHSGAGAGMCIEDCYILSSLIADVTDAKNLETAFKAYDEVRRPRSLKLVKESKEAGMLYDFEGPTGDDIEALESNMKHRMNWIWDADISLDLEQARMIFNQNAKDALPI